MQKIRNQSSDRDQSQNQKASDQGAGRQRQEEQQQKQQLGSQEQTGELGLKEWQEIDRDHSADKEDK